MPHRVRKEEKCFGGVGCVRLAINALLAQRGVGWDR